MIMHHFSGCDLKDLTLAEVTLGFGTLSSTIPQMLPSKRYEEHPIIFF